MSLLLTWYVIKRFAILYSLKIALTISVFYGPLEIMLETTEFKMKLTPSVK